MSLRAVKIASVLPQYHTVLLDAYGVLVNQAGAIPGAAAFLRGLQARGQPYFLLTNDASRSPGTIAARFAGFGLSIPEAQIITSGSLLTAYFAAQKLQGARCLVFGPADSHAYVRAAGGEPLAPVMGAEADALVVCDDSGVELLPALEAAVTWAMRRLDRGLPAPMLLCNPDLIYPKGHDAYGITSGSVALVVEAALQVRHAAQAPRFVRLGKPHTPIFAAAEARAGTRQLLMVGDQLGTDIQGARDYGIDSVLMCTGLTRWQAGTALTPAPTHVCLDLT